MPIDVATPAGQLRALTWGPADAPIALVSARFSRHRPRLAQGRAAAGRRGVAGGGAVHARLRAVVDRLGRQLSHRCADGRRVAGAGRGRPDGTRRGHRSRLGCDGGRRAGRDARQPVRQGRDHVGAAGRGVAAQTRRRRAPLAGGVAAQAGDPELVHAVLPIALAARTIRVLDRAAAVATMVARLRRDRRSRACRRRDRITGELARGAGLLSRHAPAGFGAARGSTPNCTDTGRPRCGCRRCTCTAPTTDA